MSSIIALFLFVQFNADVYWYVGAVFLWAAHLLFHADFVRSDPDAPYLGGFVLLAGIVTGGLVACIANPTSRDFITTLIASVSG